MPETIGFVGLGIMGRPMSRNLLKAGYPLVVYDIVPAAVAEIAAAGASAAKSAREAAARSDVVILMLPDSPEVEAALTGPEGVFAGTKPGTTIIDMSTISPVAERQMAAEAESRGLPYLDAPVSGGEVGAINATLAIMVGGKQDLFDRCLPILQVMGKNINLVGDSGAGQVCKACNQVVVALTIEAVAEALTLAKKAGVDPAKVRQAIGGGLAQSRILEVHGQRMIDHSFNPGFRVRYHLKDMNIIMNTGKEYGASLPASAAVTEMFKSLVANGYGNDDHSALLRVIERLSGVGTETKA